jgi:hypothetical protein
MHDSTQNIHLAQTAWMMSWRLPLIGLRLVWFPGTCL